MANMRDVNKRILGVHVPRELYHALAQEAEARKMSLSEFCRFILNEEIFRLGTELTETRKNQIKEEIQNATDARIK